MGDIVATAFAVAAVIAVVSLLAGAITKSRRWLVFGGTLGASVALTWVLGLLGIPAFILFGFLGTGFLWRPREKS